ncbi:MAG: energy-coupling factor transporter transmembrane protein EcfT [Candidatus Wallbacteria bacterium]|nr:energy-coupling factor transporter transmembrane protein EcfT [Candidatus Wallbacteria bacterium]
MLPSAARLVIGQYIPLESFVHRLNPFLKLVLTFCLMVGLFVFTTPQAYTAFLLFWLLSYRLARLTLAFFLRAVRPLLVVILFTVVLHVFFTKGQPLWELGPIQITREGLHNAAHFSARLILLVNFTSLLTLTTSAIELTFAIEKLLKPLSRLGFPAQDFAMMLTIALRFIPVLFNEMDKIVKAQTCRAVQFRSGSVARRVRNYLAILVPLFINAFQRALELAQAMDVRCYQAGRERGRFRVYPVAIRDVAAVLGTSTLFALLIGLRTAAR